MSIESSEKILEALKLIQINLCVVSTIDESGSPDSAVVYFHFDKELNIYFMTQADSRKCKNIQKNPEIAFATFSEHPPKTIQMKGAARLIVDKAEKESCLASLKETAVKSTLLPPIFQINEMINKSEIVVVKISPLWARLGDFDIYREQKTFYESNKA